MTQLIESAFAGFEKIRQNQLIRRPGGKQLEEISERREKQGQSNRALILCVDSVFTEVHKHLL